MTFAGVVDGFASKRVLVTYEASQKDITKSVQFNFRIIGFPRRNRRFMRHSVRYSHSGLPGAKAPPTLR